MSVTWSGPKNFSFSRFLLVPFVVNTTFLNTFKHTLVLVKSTIFCSFLRPQHGREVHPHATKRAPCGPGSGRWELLAFFPPFFIIKLSEKVTPGGKAVGFYYIYISKNYRSKQVHKITFGIKLKIKYQSSKLLKKFENHQRTYKKYWFSFIP